MNTQVLPGCQTRTVLNNLTTSAPHEPIHFQEPSVTLDDASTSFANGPLGPNQASLQSEDIHHVLVNQPLHTVRNQQAQLNNFPTNASHRPIYFQE